MLLDDAQLMRMAEAIADGLGVDWVDAESSARTVDQRELVRHLHVLADVANLHRSGDADAPAAAVKPTDPNSAKRLLTSWGSLEIRALIGGGMFGAVYRAWDPLLDREVALKILH